MPVHIEADTAPRATARQVVDTLNLARQASLFDEHRDALSVAIRIVELVTAADPAAAVVETSRRAANRLGGDVDTDDAETMIRRANRTVCRIAGVEPVR